MNSGLYQLPYINTLKKFFKLWGKYVIANFSFPLFKPAHFGFHFLEMKPFPLIKESHQLVSFVRLGKGGACRMTGQKSMVYLFTQLSEGGEPCGRGQCSLTEW